MWNGSFWEHRSLFALNENFVVSLAHSGNPCPALLSSSNLTVILMTGIQVVHVVYCGCGTLGPGAFPYIQLLHMRLFPASHKSPHTTVSFECLELFHMLTLQGKLTGFDFYTTLEHLMDNSGVDPPSVSNRSDYHHEKYIQYNTFITETA